MLNLNEQLYGDLCDLHFWYCIHPKNQAMLDNGRTIVELPCIANFKDQNEITEGWSYERPKKLEKLINQARRVCPFPDFKQKRKLKSKPPHTAQN